MTSTNISMNDVTRESRSNVFKFCEDELKAALIEVKSTASNHIGEYYGRITKEVVLFLLAKLIYPLTTPVMINDFKACGGFVLLATGLRIAKIKEFPIADMIPAMILVMPISAIWVNYIAPLL